jgi:uncharacterized membrane protein HdeD (DUF308 family)
MNPVTTISSSAARGGRAAEIPSAYGRIARGQRRCLSRYCGKAGPDIGRLLLGLVSLAAGVIALVWPGPTALVLALVVGIWAIFGGFLEIFAGFGSGESAGTRTMFILTGLVWVVFGVVTLALLFGFFELIAGVTLITRGIEVRRTGKTLHSVMPQATKAA